MLTTDHRQNRASDPKKPVASIQKGRAPETGVPLTLERLLPDLRRIAAQRAGDALDADDLLQHLSEDALLYQRRHHQLENRGYHRQRAWHRAADSLKHARIYRSHVAFMPVCVDEDGLDVDLAELLPAPGATPEEHVIAVELRSQLRSRLTETQYRIVALLLDGYSQTDVAAELGVRAQNITYHITQIRQRISKLDVYSPTTA